MAASSDYRLGSIWLVNFDPSVGTEIRKTRPAVIISGTAFNQRSLRHSSTHHFCCSQRWFTTRFACNSLNM
jgi:Growth inhibitor